jgi:hypothetical protein
MNGEILVPEYSYIAAVFTPGFLPISVKSGSKGKMWGIFRAVLKQSYQIWPDLRKGVTKMRGEKQLFL